MQISYCPSDFDWDKLHYRIKICCTHSSALHGSRLLARSDKWRLAKVSPYVVQPWRTRLRWTLTKICSYLWPMGRRSKIQMPNFLSGSLKIQNWHWFRSKICMATSHCTCCVKDPRASACSNNGSSTSFSGTFAEMPHCNGKNTAASLIMQLLDRVRVDRNCKKSVKLTLNENRQKKHEKLSFHLAST